MGRDLVPHESRAVAIRKLVSKGWTADEIAVKLSKGDRRKALSVMMTIEKMANEDLAMLAGLGMAAKGRLALDLPEAARAVGRRAKRGNVPAAKLLFEASGFHSPKMHHEHSGDININVKVAKRPDPVQDTTAIDDAEVVED